jgi:hypothetical protein
VQSHEYPSGFGTRQTLMAPNTVQGNSTTPDKRYGLFIPATVMMIVAGLATAATVAVRFTSNKLGHRRLCHYAVSCVPVSFPEQLQAELTVLTLGVFGVLEDQN